MNTNIQLIIIIIIQLIDYITSIPIDNAVVNDPDIICHPDSIEITIETRNNFEGHLYVKNKYEVDACRSSANINGLLESQANIRLPFGDECLVSRRRSLNPKGIFADVTVIISFHPSFMTKVDRAYTIQCFYMEADKTVDTDIEVSMITTGFQTQFVPMPVCRYEILDQPDGEPVEYTLIGQSVYHKWTCLTDTGCAQDRYIMNNLEYTADLMAGVEAHVFKYADRPALYFNCQIDITVKEPNGDCATQVQPSCPVPDGAGGRKKRSAESSVGILDVETTFNPLDFDLQIDFEKNLPSFASHYLHKPNNAISRSAETICLSPLIFVFMGIITSLVLVSCFFVMFYWTKVNKGSK